jgi:hypothetical protein
MERLIPLFRYYLLALAAVMSSEAAAVCSQTTTPSVTSTIQYACSKCQKGIPIQGTQTETGRKKEPYLLRCALTLDLCVERSGGTHLHEHELQMLVRRLGHVLTAMREQRWYSSTRTRICKQIQALRICSWGMATGWPAIPIAHLHLPPISPCCSAYNRMAVAVAAGFPFIHSIQPHDTRRRCV